MGKDKTRNRGGRSPSSGSDEKARQRREQEAKVSEDSEEWKESDDEGYDDGPKKTLKQRQRATRRDSEQKSNVLVTLFAIAIVGAIVAGTMVQRWRAGKAQSPGSHNGGDDDVTPLDEYAAEDDGDDLEEEPISNQQRERTPLNDSAARTKSGGQSRDRVSKDEQEDYDDGRDDLGDDEDDDGGGYEARAGGAGHGGGGGDDTADMQPTDPMEDDDFDDGRDMHLEKPGDSADKYAGSLNSLMRPHQAVKSEFWKTIQEKALAKGGKQLDKAGHIIHVEDVLTAGECLKLIKHHEALTTERDDPPSWCFESEEWINRALDESQVGQEAETFQINQSGTKGMYCAKSAEVNDRLSAKYPHSTATLVARGENDDVDAVERKLESSLGLPKDNAYHTQLIKYRQGEKYYPHVDCNPSQSPNSENRNDRYATIIIYLSDVKKGGGTTFTSLGVTVKPKRGSAIVFKNLDSKSACNMAMTHRGDAPLSGVKYIYQHWYHETIIMPSYMQNIILCDNSDSCREYIHAKATRDASDLVRKGDMARPNIKKGADFYRKAIEKQPLHAQALLYLADSLAQLKQDREALKYFEKHLKLHPKSIDGNFVAAGIWQDMGRKSKAIDLLQRVVAVSPHDGDALFNIAALYAEEGRKKQAVSALQQLVKVSPRDHGAHTFLAELLTDLGDEETAAKHQKLAAQYKTKSRQ